MPPDWLWSIFSGGYKHMGTELSLSNTHLHKEGVVKGDGELVHHREHSYAHTYTQPSHTHARACTWYCIYDEFARSYIIRYVIDWGGLI